MNKKDAFIKDVETLSKMIINGEIGNLLNESYITGSSYIYQTTQFPGTDIKYHNYYLLIRVGSYFGACSFVENQTKSEMAALLSGTKLKDAIESDILPVKIAAMDAFLGNSFPHAKECVEVVKINPGTPVEKANKRDRLIADLADVKKDQKVALIGVVDPLVEAIKYKGGICLPCDLKLVKTKSGDLIEKDMEKVLKKADSIICTAMTLSNSTFNRIIEVARNKNIPLTVYAQTGSAVISQFIGKGVTGLLAEPFPFTQFSALTSELYIYK